MSPEIRDVEDAVIRARKQALDAGVKPEHADAVAATMATLELLRASGSDHSATVLPTAVAFQETFAEWAQQYDLGTHIARFAAIAYYLFKNEGVQAVNTSDMGRMYDKARWKRPVNLADVFAKGAQKLYFVEAEENAGTSEDGPKLWRLTSTGYNYLQSLRKGELK